MKFWKWWPVLLLLILVPVAFLFNPDGVITPLLRAKGFKTGTILIISGGVGTTDMLLWYIGWGGIRNLVIRWFEEDVDFAKKIAGEMKRDGQIDGIKIYFTRKYKKLSDRADKLRKGLRAGSYLSFFWLGFWPTPGPRVIGDFICGTTKLKRCFIALCLGNFIKTSYLLFAWDKAFSFFGW